MKKKILYTKPSITSLEEKYALDAVRNGWGEQCYLYINRFEKSFAEHLNVRFCIATSSCTGAMHMGLAALGLKEGDEVILADTNWIATVSPVVALGAKPVFVDIMPDTWCLDPDKVKHAINKNTKAIIATHLYGNLCEINELLALSEKFGIPLIEDSAEALGSSYYGKKAGSFGTFSTFSFHGTKTITTGEGGIFATDNEALFNDVLTLSNHGRERFETKQFWPSRVGYKYKMSNLQAAIGCAQVERIDEILKRKKHIFSQYQSILGDNKKVKLNHEQDYAEIGAWMPTVMFERSTNVNREEIQAAFEAENIDARVFFWPLSSLPMFEKCNNINSYDIAERSINLPSYHDMTDEQIHDVCCVVRSLIK